jgi:hypothetical protein
MDQILTSADPWQFIPPSCRTEATSVLVLQCLAPAMGLMHTGLVRTAEKGPFTTFAKAVKALDSGEYSSFGRDVFAEGEHTTDAYTRGTRRDYRSAEELGTEPGCVDCAYESYGAMTVNIACENVFSGVRNYAIRKTCDGQHHRASVCVSLAPNVRASACATRSETNDLPHPHDPIDSVWKFGVCLRSFSLTGALAQTLCSYQPRAAKLLTWANA